MSHPSLVALQRSARLEAFVLVGSEAVHARDPRWSLRQAYAIVFAKQRRLFAIGSAH